MIDYAPPLAIHAPAPKGYAWDKGLLLPIKESIIFISAAGGGGGGPSDTGFVLAGAGATVDTGGGSAWTNPGNITADDDTTSTSVHLAANQSDTLRGSTFGLSVSGTIVGLEVQGQLSSTSSSTISYVNVGKDDSTLGTQKTPGTTLTTTPTNYAFGGSSDLWGLSWTDTEVNASTFQILFRTTSTGFAVDVCDAVWVKVYYT